MSRLKIDMVFGKTLPSRRSCSKAGEPAPTTATAAAAPGTDKKPPSTTTIATTTASSTASSSKSDKQPESKPEPPPAASSRRSVGKPLMETASTDETEPQHTRRSVAKTAEPATEKKVITEKPKDEAPGRRSLAKGGEAAGGGAADKKPEKSKEDGQKAEPPSRRSMSKALVVVAEAAAGGGADRKAASDKEEKIAEASAAAVTEVKPGHPNVTTRRGVRGAVGAAKSEDSEVVKKSSETVGVPTSDRDNGIKVDYLLFFRSL